ncbi:hypothetical protein LCGC14_1340270 [marine sediment metagenome]|uniref:NADP-dependent oxidoreductase domain-containing protein n=1 Tax=marine sediment metagenome TaxID=412755 RepID=A0A0F9L0A1_9ZZZZ
MQTRRLGRTDLDLGVISLGTEYLIEVPRETVVSVVHEAVDRGVNYFDVLFAYPHYRDNFGAAFAGLRDRVLIAGHLGIAEQDGQCRMTRDVAECEALLEDLLMRLGADHVDVVFLSNCDEPADFERIMAPGGLLDLAHKLRDQGKARWIGFSGHQVPVSLRAVESGAVDLLMHVINLAGDAAEGRQGLYHACAAAGMGLIAMKPYGGGALLAGYGPADPAAVPFGGDVALKTTPTPVQCLSYALSQPGVTAVVPGVKSIEELHAALAFLDADDEARDYSPLLAHFQDALDGQCVYCNHCLPCPVGIDVGKTLRLAASAAGGVTDALAG